MKRTKFMFFESYLESVEDLPREIRGVLFDAIILYSLRDKIPEFSSDDTVAKAVFTAIKPVLDISKIKAESGSKGGKAKAKDKQKTSKPKAKKKQTNSKREAIGGEGRGKEKDKKTFTPPSVDDVCAYFTKNGYSSEAGSKAFYYYHETNWKDSNGKKVKNWKQKMLGVWFKEENKTQAGSMNKDGSHNGVVL